MDRIGEARWQPFGPLMGAPAVRDQMVRMDRVLDSIENFEDLDLMATYLDRLN